MALEFTEVEEVPSSAQPNEFVEALQHLLDSGKLNSKAGLSFTVDEGDKGKVISQLTRAGDSLNPPVTVKRRFEDPVDGKVKVFIRIADKITKGKRTETEAAPSGETPNVGVTANTPDDAPAAPKTGKGK